MPIFAPIAHFSGCGWLMTLMAVTVVLPLALLPKCWSGLPKPIVILEILWMGVLTAALLPASSQYWPSDNAFAVPLTILALSALTTPKVAPGVMKVLTLCAAVLVIPILAAAASKLEPAWLKPAWNAWPWGLTIGLLLANLPVISKKRGLIPAVLGLSVLTQGIVSLGVASRIPDVLYQTARTLGRLEPIAAATMTLLWYTMCTAIEQSAVYIAKENEVEVRTAYVLHTGTAAVLILSKWQLQQHKTAILSALFLVLIPFFRKMKKVKNSA